MAVLISLKKPLGASVIVFKTFQDFWKLPTGTGLLHSIWTTPGRAMKAGALLAGCERPSLRAPLKMLPPYGNKKQGEDFVKQEMVLVFHKHSLCSLWITIRF